VIAQIFTDGTPLQVQQKVQHIMIHVDRTRNEDKSLWWLIKQLVIPANYRAMFAACGLMAISQLGGFISILYYSGTLFAAVGFDKPIAVGTIIAATNFVFTLHLDQSTSSRPCRPSPDPPTYTMGDGGGANTRRDLFPLDPTQPRPRTYFAQKQLGRGSCPRLYGRLRGILLCRRR
jgi:hypothetical protein